ncbi:hypothetical protein [Peribacillus kribbensis]|uniref:hypothetical protein n=1 Tax=Peribacillus kribbensis TaxID=356658 RepID=UPI000417EB21|nr:hypothetical protein [Peribacillus kribbensis]
MKLRTYFAVILAAIIFLLTAFLGISISRISSAKVEMESGSSLSGLAFQMADKMDFFMWSRMGTGGCSSAF